jgi:hypothetical protein
MSEPLKIWVGRHVELEVRYEDGETERLSLDVVSDSAADFERGFLGESTPLAKAILGQAAGSDAAYPGGTVRVLAVSPSQNAAPTDAAKRREETIQKAVRDSERTNQVLFASSFSGKWGDYDPDGLKEEDDDLLTER